LFARPAQPSPASGEIADVVAGAPKPRRTPVSDQHVNAAWQARLRASPIAPALTLTTEGIVRGAGTVLVAATAPRRLSGLQGQEVRVLALLAAAYGKPIALSVLGNIERAAKAWRERGRLSRPYPSRAYPALFNPRRPSCGISAVLGRRRAARRRVH